MLDPDKVFHRTSRCLFRLEQLLNFRQNIRRSISLTVNIPTFARRMLKCLTQIGSSTTQTMVWKCFLSATQIQPKRQRKWIPKVSALTLQWGLRKCLVYFLLEVELLLSVPLFDNSTPLLILILFGLLYDGFILLLLHHQLIVTKNSSYVTTKLETIGYFSYVVSILEFGVDIILQYK